MIDMYIYYIYIYEMCVYTYYTYTTLVTYDLTCFYILLSWESLKWGTCVSSSNVNGTPDLYDGMPKPKQTNAQELIYKQLYT